jgi:two-component system response regulator FlrC
MSGQAYIVDASPIAVAAASRQMLRRAASVAACESSVLITGETGSGKTMLAQYIHSVSSRRASPVVSLHGIDTTSSLFDDALVRGHGGTLILESLTEFSAELQGRLVRLLQQPAATRNIRVIATAPSGIREAVRSGALRHDLYFLITELTVAVSPLRDRIEDILPLAARFLSERAQSDEPMALSAESIELLRQHPWPGNIRELFNTLRRAAVLSTSRILGPELIELDSIDGVPVCHEEQAVTLSNGLSASDPITIDGRGIFARQRDQAERAILLAALRDGRSTRIDVAQKLGISPRTLRYKLARLRAAGMEVPA